MDFFIKNVSLIFDAAGDSVRINLVQMSEMFSDGRLLAYYESSARNFLYPYQSHSSTYSIRDRELLLERTVAFPVRTFVYFKMHCLLLGVTCFQSN